MADFDIDTVLGWRGRTVRDPHGEKIGTVGDVFLDERTDRPAWIGVKTGWFGTHESYVALSKAREDGDEIHVPYDRDVVRGAPQIEPEVALTAEEEAALYRHYGESYDAGTDDAHRDAGADRDPGAGAAAPAGGSPEVLRSEEEVRLGQVERRPVERVRIKKVLVTDHVKQVVPVRKEVVEVVHDPPGPGEDAGPAESPEHR